MNSFAMRARGRRVASLIGSSKESVMARWLTSAPSHPEPAHPESRRSVISVYAPQSERGTIVAPGQFAIRIQLASET